MSKEIIYNYDKAALEDYKKRDRRIMKFQGFFLSEHNEDIQQNLSKEQQKYSQKMKEQQSEEVISSLLDTMYRTKGPAIIQLNVTDLEQQMTFYVGKLAGFSEDLIFLQLKDNSIESINYSLVRNIELTKNVKWFK